MWGAKGKLAAPKAKRRQGRAGALGKDSRGKRDGVDQGEAKKRQGLTMECSLPLTGKRERELLLHHHKFFSRVRIKKKLGNRERASIPPLPSFRCLLNLLNSWCSAQWPGAYQKVNPETIWPRVPGLAVVSVWPSCPCNPGPQQAAFPFWGDHSWTM